MPRGQAGQMQGSETCLTGTQLHAATVLEIRGEFPLIPSSASSAHPGVHISQNTRLSFHRVCAQSCPTLCNSMDYSPPRLLRPQDSLGKNTGVRSHSLLQGIFQPRDWTQVSHIAGRFSTSWATREAWSTWEGNPKSWGYMYMSSWFTFLYSRN